MQAKNYAAQVVDQIDGNGFYTSLSGCTNAPQDKIKSFLVDAKGLISRGLSFLLPDGGVVLDSGLLGITHKDISLPFPITLVSSPNIEGHDFLTVAFEFKTDDKIRVAVFFKTNKSAWILIPIIGFFEKHTPISRINKNPSYLVNYSYPLSEEVGNIEFWQNMMSFGIYGLFELLEALSCKNVEQTIIQKCDVALNARRVNKGKLPLYEERILTIKVNAKQGTGTRTGTHESPRQHLRRGHIRRLESGNIWVNACVVGSSEKGVIKKSYNVAA